jgi:cellulose synthase (UDP-forming)
MVILWYMDLASRSNASKQPGHGPHLHGPTLSLIVAIAGLGAVLYARFIYNFHNAGDIVPYILVAIAEGIILLQALISLWTILSGGFNPRDYYYHAAKGKLLTKKNQLNANITEPLMLAGKAATIDVFIPVYGEAIDTIRQTAIAARNIIGHHNTYILDDGKSDAVEAMALSIDVKYIRRLDNIGNKAGNINHALSLTWADFFVIFDADFVADPNFLLETLPFFIKYNVGFVQTPQHYNNLNNLISRGASYMQNVFYKLIQPGKNRFNAAFCVGTNVIFRRSAIDAVGGINQTSKSEDIWTSLMLHEAGYQSIFINDILAVGDAPETISSYFKQQLRWATGGFEILLHHNFFKSPLDFDQKLQYFGTAAYYLNGLAIFLLMFLPPLHIFFNLSPVNLSIGFATWLLFYLGFYGMQIVVAFYSMEGFRLETIVLAMASFPIYLKALINVLRNKDVAWLATGDAEQRDNPLNFVSSQILLFLFLAFTSVFGAWKVYYTGVFSLSLVWNLINTTIFGAFLVVVYKEHRLHHSRAARKAHKLISIRIQEPAQ